MKIDISDPGFYFGLFYVLSNAVVFVLFILYSIRLKVPLRYILLLLTTVSLCTIAGSRLSTIPISDWGQIIISGRYEGSLGRYAVGGMFFGLAGLVLSQHILGINKAILNLYAWIAPAGFGIQKIGCFLNGCCYGKLSDLPWSVQYPAGANAHFHQWVNGVIEEDAAFSLKVHPVQLYEVILLFTIAFIVWRSQKFWKKTWSSLIFSLSLFFILRFSVEFLRDPASSNFDTSSILGITFVQWFLLSMGVVCSLFLLFYEKFLNPVNLRFPKEEQSIKNTIGYVFIVSAAVYAFRSLFTPFELLSLGIKFIPAILLAACFVFRSVKTVRFRLATTSFFVLPLLFMFQSFPSDPNKPISIRDFYGEVKSYKRIDINTSFGDFYSTVKYNPHEGTCGTAYTMEDYRYLYRMAGAGFSSVTKNAKSINTFGINLYGGINKETNLTKQWEKTDILLAVNPYLKYDQKWIGFGAGAHIGNIRWVPLGPIDKMEFDRGTRFSPIMPELLFRIGRRDKVDVQYTYGFNLPTLYPVPMHELSIGSGFGFKTDYNLRFGAAVSEDYATIFISGEALIGKKIGLTLKYNFAGSDFYSSTNYSEYIDRKGRILFGANYRFGFEK